MSLSYVCLVVVQIDRRIECITKKKQGEKKKF
jgi:hypothetical protein